MAATFRVEPFIGSMRVGFLTKEGPQHVAYQLQQLINRVAGEGWEYVGVEQVNIATSPGCLASLFGQKEGVFPFDMVIFKRTV